MGASGWSYYVAYQPDLGQALDDLRKKVFDEGDYWWAEPYEFGKSAMDFPNRPRMEKDLWASEAVKESGTHSILDVRRVLQPGEKPDYGTVEPVSEQEARECAGVTKLTRAHVTAIDNLVEHRWSGRCAVLHDDAGNPSELYFWGWSGD
ncbi:hypothetical protein [Actinoplanes regularis]|uniref:Uncharacterized protein n=1 Tax=Actinoplanes regularis TaxID=52697 RepID=A0A238X794_9ACTN|nr:hypothetical protein [Actinoplanes regularis]GIE86427.1 hypothetical protein Are01nite_29070 [Actinoplanes regularis]SNR53709.1 hypothetical protein SAMN06264365_10352 [Actinoplanes regularis]